MNKRVGMWLDEDKAVIVSITENGEGTRIFTSDMEHYVRYSGVVPGDGEPEDPRDRRFWNHIGEYYDKLIAHIRDAKAIQIIGPGEAKHELKKRLLLVGLMENMVSTENADKMTDHQVALIVRARFPVRSQFDLSTS